MPFAIKRIYAEPEDADGVRILVDRLWPRGVSKAKARLDDWMKEIAPTPELRQWFGHRAERFAEFRRRYEAELAGNPLLGELRTKGKHGAVTLLYGAHDPEINHAVVLKAVLDERP
ncbi:MAG TPA: DUF488 family protein [Stellaceae bacterium]|nr:DUF488 family protein [Stellaceae bacterium]